MSIQAAPKSVNRMTYDESILYCQFCDYDGYTNWRLPTMDEALELIDSPMWYQGSINDLVHLEKSNFVYLEKSGHLNFTRPVRDV